MRRVVRFGNSTNRKPMKTISTLKNVGLLFTSVLCAVIAARAQSTNSPVLELTKSGAEKAPLSCIGSARPTRFIALITRLALRTGFRQSRTLHPKERIPFGPTSAANQHLVRAFRQPTWKPPIDFIVLLSPAICLTACPPRLPLATSATGLCFLGSRTFWRAHNQPRT